MQSDYQKKLKFGDESGYAKQQLYNDGFVVNGRTLKFRRTVHLKQLPGEC